MLGDAFGKPGLTVDTHFARLAQRLGWTAHSDREKIEQESRASSVVVRQATAVPLGVLTRVSLGQVATPLQKVAAPGPPLTIDGKPTIIFVSEESCPFCAAERWPLVVALSHFGSWSGLGSTRSSATDVYPNTATFSFRAARYRSTGLTLRTTELADNVGRPLQPETPPGRQAHRRLRRAAIREQRRPVRSHPVPRHRQPLHPGRRAVRSPGPRRPVRSSDCQSAPQPVESSRESNRRSAQVIIAAIDQFLHDQTAPS